MPRSLTIKTIDAIGFGRPLLCDDCGIVVKLSPHCGPTASSSLFNDLLVLAPVLGWDSDLDGPKDLAKYAIIGASNHYPHGAAQDFIVNRESEAECCPDHLSPVEGVALPLLKGIGGGVALQVLQIGVAIGCNVFVTSGSDVEIDKAVRMDAKGGINYKTEAWKRRLRKMLPFDRAFLDAVIDGAGSDIIAKASCLLKPGGVICSYGMTVGPKMDWSMQAVLKHIDLLCCTTGSRVEFKAFMEFVKEHRLRPIVSRTVKGLDNFDAIDKLFQDMKLGKQVGKLVIEVDSTSQLDKSLL
ncbi:hypothetical protein MMC18_005071 [Xylographa bjoerkii]|nr:hypothetical protein [Xylographa bjoerkii]